MIQENIILFRKPPLLGPPLSLPDFPCDRTSHLDDEGRSGSRDPSTGQLFPRQSSLVVPLPKPMPLPTTMPKPMPMSLFHRHVYRMRTRAIPCDDGKTRDYASSLQKWCNLGLAPLNPNYTTSGTYFDNRASPPNVSEPFL